MQITRFERGLRDRVALVTGAAIGNGRAFCERLAEEGAKLIIADLEEAVDTERAVLELGGEVVSIRADMTNPADVERVVHTAIERFGHIDILVHNAGIGSYGPVESQPPAEIDPLLDTNLRAPLAPTHALPPLLAAGRGALVFVGSVAGGRAGAPHRGVAGRARGGRAGLEVLHRGVVARVQPADLAVDEAPGVAGALGGGGCRGTACRCSPGGSIAELTSDRISS